MTTKKSTTRKAPPQRAYRRSPGRLTVETVREALRAGAGIRAYAAEKLGVHRSTICRFVADHPELEREIEEITDTLVDRTEAKLIRLIEKEEFPAIKFYLEQKGRRAGYGRKVELTGKDGGPIRLRDMSELTDAQLDIVEAAARALAGSAAGDGG